MLYYVYVPNMVFLPAINVFDGVTNSFGYENYHFAGFLLCICITTDLIFVDFGIKNYIDITGIG